MTDFYDPLYGPIAIPQVLKPIVTSETFARLHYLRQLGLCYLSFPGGNHTRFEHSVGACHLGQLVARSLVRSSALTPDEKRRLSLLLPAAALCHDIGHGPFSHMTENVMHGLGATLTHEDVGAALVIGRLGDAMAGLESEGVGARVVAAMLTHTPVPGDAVAACAQALVSSDLDVDRLDYLYRDSHYSGGFESLQGHLNLISSAWSPSRHASGLYAELTEEGIVFAERVLLLRRDNYRRIVFEHRHMAATGMFEKAVLAAVEGEGDLAGRVKSLLTHKPDLETDQGVGAIIDAAGPVYGLTDHAALSLVSRGSAISRYLIQRIRRGQLYEQVRTTRWDALHYVAQARLSSLSTPRAAFSFRRDLEASLATEVGVDAHHIVVQIDQLRPPAELLLGTVEGGSMAQRSSLGRFFRDDYYRQYILTLFVDPMLGQQREKLSDLWRKKFVTSELPI